MWRHIFYSEATTIKSFTLTLTLVTLLLFSSCCGFQIIPIGNDYNCEIYSPEDKIPLDVLEEARQMYLEAYLYPPLHAEIPFEELKIDQNFFNSYEEYIDDMFRKDFTSYGSSDKPMLHYCQLRQNDSILVGVCVVLEQAKSGYYYLDHIGIHRKFRRQGLATALLEITIGQLSDFIEISLDTRVFNFPAQALYEKFGFKKCLIHPCPEKQSAYCHYILQN